MKTTTIMVGDNGAYMEVKAYKVIDGLLIHRATHNYKGKASQTKGNYWTVRHYQGQIVRNFVHYPLRLKDVVAWVNKYLAPLKWDMDEEDLERLCGPGTIRGRAYYEAVSCSRPEAA